MTDIVERLRAVETTDHERGCQGREYTCTCGWDERVWKDAAEAADEIERLREQNEQLHTALADKLAGNVSFAVDAGLEAAAKLIEEGFDRPGINKKQDQCPHQKFEWEDCEMCAVLAIRALKGKPKEPV